MGFNQNYDKVSGYGQKMDAILSKAFDEWWMSLTKDEILDYLRSQPTITAESLRAMLKNEKATLLVDTSFSLVDNSVKADFHTEIDNA